MKLSTYWQESGTNAGHCWRRFGHPWHWWAWVRGPLWGPRVREVLVASTSDSRQPRASASASFMYLAAGLVDEPWLHIAPFTVGAGEQLLRGVPPLDLEMVEARGTDLSTHLRYHVRR